MPKLEVFFDYACPYCLRGHEYLIELLPEYQNIEVEWCPCEAHPRPESYGPHSDLLARGMYVALDHGADIMEYHKRMYHAALTDRMDIEDLDIVTGLTHGLLNSEAFRKELSSGAYLDRLQENNRLAWERYRFSAVPSYRMGELLLKCTENIGVNKKQLEEFLNQH